MKSIICQSVPPIFRLLMAVHDRKDEYGLRLIQINHQIGKLSSEGAADRRAELEEAFRLPANFIYESLDFIVEATAELRVNPGIIFGRLGIFAVCFRMKQMRLHRPTILRICAETSSPGMHRTLPV